MTQAINAASKHTKRNQCASRWELLAKSLILKQLRKLHTGELIIEDGDQRIIFGKPHHDLTAHITIQDPAAYISILCAGSIGASEAYMTKDWETPNLTDVVRVMARNKDVVDNLEGGLAYLSKPFLKWFHRLNANSEKGSKRNIAAHYDLGNDLFRTFLDPSMMYSSAIYPTKETELTEAAEYKLKLICERLQLTCNDTVVEIGTGWGGFAIYAAKYYGCHVTTTTISDKQHALAAERIKQEGLEDKITLLNKDYRTLEGQFDKLVSIEMIEAVGWKFYPSFFKTCSSLLKPNGVMLIQAITIEDQRYNKARKEVDFIQRYIFPGSCIPSIQALLTCNMKTTDMRLTFQQDFAEHYSDTLKAWHNRFKERKAAIIEQGYSEEFFRLWLFYFSYCEGGFKERSIGVSHLVFAKPEYRQEPLCVQI